jgi:hypothetical protein
MCVCDWIRCGNNWRLLMWKHLLRRLEL